MSDLLKDYKYHHIVDRKSIQETEIRVSAEEKCIQWKSKNQLSYEKHH